MCKSLRASLYLVPLLLVIASCEKKGEGEGCTEDSECASGLTCDKHGRETGKCLAPHHGHGGASDASATGDAAIPDAGAAGAPAPDAATSGATDGPTVTPDSAVAPDGAPDTSPPTPDAAPTPPDALASPCEAYCTCMEQNCRMVSYPWANRAACLTACGAFSAPARTCFTTFCMSVPTVSAGEREHTCEHGSGELGAAECN